MGIVIATGDNTEVGRISQLISAAKDLETPLTRKLAQFSRVLLYAILILAAIATAIELWRGQPIIDTVTAAIALAVAMIPEGLPAALTITLAIGVSRMARRRAIIRKLPAVETLGSVSVICSDKTGTLTQNQMTVQQIAVGDSRYQVTGIGYAPSVQITKPGEASHAATDPGLQIVLRAGLLCNDSQLVQENGVWQAQGDPTEVALTVSAHKAGLRLEDLQVEYPRLDVIPFESQHQYMATLHSVGGGQERVVYLKGAAEVLLEMCSQALDESGASIPLDRNRLHQEVESMASQGLRVLAFAMKTLPAGQNALTTDMVAFDLTFLGVQAMIDPPRSEAVAAVQACQNAGIRVKMITGDHALTAAAIARQIGLNGAATDSEGMPTVITSKEMANLTDQELIEVAERIDVFARVSPEQKLRLVEALQARNQVVAMTGDGVNDGPALKQSNIGIAMGITGTEVAKEAADMVLTDDNFATIEAAVEEGRGVFDNLTKIISWTLPTNLGEGLIILLALLLGVALPILPIQILWINMISVAVLGTVLALEIKELNIMRRPPRHPDAPILTRELLWRIVLVSGLILIGAFGLFEWELQSGNSLTQARTVAVNMVVLIEIAYLLNCRSLTQSMFRIGLFSNPWIWVGITIMLVLQLAFTYLPFMNQLFSSAPIALGAWARILGVTLAGYLLIEAEKWIRRQVQSARTDRKREALIGRQGTA
jgi:Ca2+-transporting ATPase